MREHVLIGQQNARLQHSLIENSELLFRKTGPEKYQQQAKEEVHRVNVLNGSVIEGTVQVRRQLRIMVDDM